MTERQCVGRPNDQNGLAATLDGECVDAAHARRPGDLTCRRTGATAGKPLDGLRTWATEIQARAHHNKAACALANTLARVCYAVLRDHTPYGNPQPRQEKKLTRTAFAIVA